MRDAAYVAIWIEARYERGVQIDHRVNLVHIWF